MANKWRDFDYFGHDEENPIGKYTQPKKNPKFTKGSGYPEDDIDRRGTKTYGRYVEGQGGKKNKLKMRGKGAAERGYDFYDDDEPRDEVRTKGR